MRLTYFACLALLAIIPFSHLSAQDKKPVRLIFEPEFGYTVGETQYDMLYPAVEGLSGFTGLRSLLEFPLGNPVAGISLRLEGPRTARFPLTATLGVVTDLGNPRGKMRDGDWYLSGSAADFKWSYTESDPKLSYLSVNLETRLGLPSTSGSRFDLVGGLRYLKIVQDIDNFVGWQYDTLMNFYVINEHDIRALYYRITYVSPYVGFRLHAGKPQRLQFHIQAALAPTHMSDLDDHYLRYKSSTASGWGEGVMAESGIRFPFQKSNARSPYLEFRLKGVYIHGSPKQTQSWYGDDPFTDENDTGRSFSGVPHEITLTELNFSVKVGFEL